MPKNIVVTMAPANVMEADIVAIQDWEGFDTLASYLESQHAAQPTEKLDGPESLIWKFQINGSVIALHNNPDGNYLKVADPMSHKVLGAVVADLEARLDGDTPSADTGAPRTFANQPCPREGNWFTPADPGGQRHFKVGAIMPEVKSDYGATIWQWAEKQ